MGVGALFKADLVEWMTCTTYQAASGGGAQHMRELLTQYGALQRRGARAARRSEVGDPRDRPARDRAPARHERRRDRALRRPARRQPDPVDRRRPRRRHQPGGVEGQRRDQQDPRPRRRRRAAVPIDSICVRVGAMRCHSQSLTIKLKSDVPLADIAAMIAADNEWVHVVPNTRAASVRELTPVAVSGTMKIPVGRLRKLAMGPTTWARSRSATSFCGAPPSRFDACCGSCSSDEPACKRPAALSDCNNAREEDSEPAPARTSANA